ncbi:hypothetical protein [Bradyrhizobium sp.]|uniref:hypothetical protein n=1 Tax=Bradyrhizobium sp. TaxID=376 RepID=UPI0025BFCC28|nr:hypothetical protein [Bradyrhizobium sp.]
MSIELSRIELTGAGGTFSGWLVNSPVSYFRSAFVWLPVALIAGLGAWTLLAGYASKPAESEPVGLATAVVADPAPSSAAAPANSVPASQPPTAGGEAVVPAETAPVDGLKISSQYWRRGGLGSKALITFTLRNNNDYAVRDIAISCAFSRRDGSHLTDRSRVIHDTVDKRSRKTFAGTHVGFVNVNASKAKCSLIAASHI